ncbi:MAG: class I SAM-dependent methyltransferase [Phycisphaerales bacterium]|nr:class I SAM-dependent methyltransferase [Phycisphaerales bacterium]
MVKRPLLLRGVPSPVRRRLKGLLRPYAMRFLEAYFGEYAGMAQPNRLNERLAVSATHLPIPRYVRGPGGLWGYMRMRVDADGQRWSDGLPIPPKHLWHGYTDDTEQMMQIGLNNNRTIRRILAASGGEPRPGEKILDFGCAAGFVLRHFRDIAEDPRQPLPHGGGGEVWGVDVSGPHVDWCLRHLMPPFRFALNSSLPSLPFPDGYFDVVYCISVFSHMGENCDGWLLELARVLRPGGRLYLSVVTKQSMWDYLRDRPQLGFSRAMRDRFTPEQLQSDFVTAVVQNGPGCHAVYDLDAFKTKCQNAFEILSITPNAHSFQWAVVLRRP